MITLADLKAPGLWKFKMHADGSDKGGRFSINFHECEVNGIKLVGFRKEWRSGAGASGYSVDGVEAATLIDVVALLNQRFTAGDDKEARDD
jgi:hypothetical protein